MMRFNWRGVTKATWVRIVALFLVWANQVCNAFFDFQLLPFTDEQIYEGVSIALTFIVTVWTTWRNNSFTEEAQVADQYLKSVREGK